MMTEPKPWNLSSRGITLRAARQPELDTGGDNLVVTKALESLRLIWNRAANITWSKDG